MPKNVPATTSLRKCQSPTTSRPAASRSNAERGQMLALLSLMKTPANAPANTMCPEGKLLFSEPIQKMKLCVAPCITSVGFGTPKSTFSTWLLMPYAHMDVRQAIAKVSPNTEIWPRTKRTRTVAKITADSADKTMAAPKAPFKSFRTRLTFQKCSAVGTSMRTNKKATTAAQATNDRNQIPMITIRRFTLRESPSRRPTSRNRVDR